MPKQPFSQLAEFDPNWLDTVDWSDPAAAQAQLKEKAVQWAKAANQKLHDYNAGMTKAQERAAQWDKWRDDGNLPILQKWNEIRAVVDQHGGVDAVLQRLQQQQQAQQDRREVQQGAAAVQAAMSTGELDWEHGQVLLQEYNAKKRELDAVVDWYNRGRAEDYKRFEEALTNVQKANLQQITALMEPLVSGVDKLLPSERKLRPVLEAMATQGYRSFEDGYNALYGEEETTARIRRELEEEHQKKFAAEKEELRRTYEQQTPGANAEGGGAVAGAGVWRRPVETKEQSRPDFYQSVLGKLGQR